MATICQVTRRVASETLVSVPGPLAVIETVPSRLVTAATANGHRRRKKDTPRATAPIDRSSQNRVRAWCHSADAPVEKNKPLNSSASAARQACAGQVSGGVYRSGLGRCTFLTL